MSALADVLNLGPHAGFIVASYLVSLAVVFGAIGWVVADHAAQKRTLAELEVRGLRRRSDRGADAA